MFSVLLQAKIDGYARLFGIFEEARMLVTRESLQIFLTTDADKSFKINVHITTNYSSHSNVTQINAMVVFENGLSKVNHLKTIEQSLNNKLARFCQGFVSSQKNFIIILRKNERL